MFEMFTQNRITDNDIDPIATKLILLRKKADYTKKLGILKITNALSAAKIQYQAGLYEGFLNQLYSTLVRIKNM